LSFICVILLLPVFFLPVWFIARNVWNFKHITPRCVLYTHALTKADNDTHTLTYTNVPAHLAQQELRYCVSGQGIRY
jgi:hypothetical protein